ncbi:MAG: hypothetical protein ABEH43_06490, partial [Flavobacteriales bacterium]
FLALFVPEGVSKHIELMEGFTFSPYINPLGFSGSDFSGEVGSNMNIRLGDKIWVSPHLGIKAMYTKNFPIGAEFGASISYEVED